MKFFRGKYLLLAAVVFFGVLFFVQDTLAQTCPAGKTGTCVTDGNCPITLNLGVCTGGSQLICCAPETPPPPPPSDPKCPAGKTGTCVTDGNCPITLNLGVCTGGSQLICCAPETPPPPPPTSSTECTQQGGLCDTSCNLITETQIGSCDLAEKCCKPKAQSGSCPGGACQLDGKCVEPNPVDSGTKCTNGGACCMPSSGGGGNMVSIEFKNPLAYDTVEGVLDSILDTIRAIIVTLALVFLVVGAVLYITSAGNDSTMKMAKGAITAAMIGLAIGLAAPSFLREISSVLGWTSVNNDDVKQALTLSEIALRVLHFLLSVVGILAIIMLVVGGIMYLTSAGSEDRAETGKKIMLYSIVGIAVALASLVIVSQIAEFFM